MEGVPLPSAKDVTVVNRDATNGPHAPLEGASHSYPLVVPAPGPRLAREWIYEHAVILISIPLSLIWRASKTPSTLQYSRTYAKTDSC
jgi:hypothetical protein